MVEVERLKIENYLVKLRFNSFALRNFSNGSFGFVGTVLTNGGRSYEIAIVLPSSYPNEAPKAYPVSPKLRSDVHMYPDGSMCLSLPEDWSAEKTVVTVIGWISHWLHNYEIYNEKGVWPARGV